MLGKSSKPPGQFNLAREAIVLDGSGRAIVGGAGAKSLQAAALGGAVADASPADDLRHLGRLLYVHVVGRAPAMPPTAPVELVPDIEPALNGLILALLSDDETRPPPPASAVSMRLRDLAGEPVDAHHAVVLAQPVAVARTPRTVGDFAIFLMTAHEMDHLGQIAAWRRAMGLTNG